MLIHVRLTGASILVVTHGYQVKEHGDDPFVNLTSKAADDFGQASLPGRFLVDMIPARECKVVVHVLVSYADKGAWQWPIFPRGFQGVAGESSLTNTVKACSRRGMCRTNGLSNRS